jgi:uncharacterized protein (TIGR02271 family)
MIAPRAYGAEPENVSVKSHTAVEWHIVCIRVIVAQPVLVSGKDGWRGIVHTWPKGANEATLRLDSGERLVVPASILTARPDGSYYAALSLDQIRGKDAEPPSTEQWSQVIPVIHEELEVGKRKVETGAGVRIEKIAREEEQLVDIPLIEERVEVERVAVNQVVEGPIAVRHVGDTIIVPVVEEVLVVQKQLRLVEELHIRKTRTEKRQPQTVQLRKEEATVERLEGDSRESGGNQSGTDDLRTLR